jgi:hypothetical protein
MVGTGRFTRHGRLGVKATDWTLYKVVVGDMDTVLRGMVRGGVGHVGGDGLEKQRVF